LQPVILKWRGEEIGPAAKVRIVPQPALVPRVLALSDGINLMSGPRIETRSVKVTLEEVIEPEQFSATVDGIPVMDVDFFCTDPLPPRFEVNFRLPDETSIGGHALEMKLGKRVVAPIGIEVVG
jgi:hypothetical protein